MSARGPVTILHFVRALVAGHEARATTDTELLRRFIDTRDDSAFTALVARHGPLVLGVCRRILPDPHDAEEAFQATFLVLARRADSVAQPALLANWLFGVARRTALRARSGRRHRVGATIPELAAPESSVEAFELRAVLDEEIGGLPEKYRAPVVLCYLEGRTNEEAARLLACPIGTVFTRLAWARERLRVRLARRGIGPPAALVAAGLSAGTALADVPAELARATAAAAVTFAGEPIGAAALSHSATSLAEGVLRAMFMTRVKQLAGLVLMFVLLGAGAGLLAYQPAPEPVTVPAPKAPADGAKLKDLMKKRRDAAKQAFDARMQRYEAGQVTPDFAIATALNLLDSELEVAETQSQRIAAHQAHRDRMAAMFAIANAQFNNGKIGPADFRPVDYQLLDAEVRLVRAKRAAR
jgi:RNA polymerase sigma factor (sigma-70 family)